MKISEDIVKKEIMSWRLGITWSDGKTEGLAGCLPEYLEEHLLIYFRELEDLREEHDNNLREDGYNFEDEEEKLV